MAEDNGDKTEAPTPRRRQQAAEQGNIARSHDLVAAALVVGSMMLLKSYGGGVILALRTLVAETMGAASLNDLSPGGATGELLRALGAAARALTPVLAGVVIIAAAGNVLQVGFRFNPAKLQPNLEALNPTRGLSRLLGARSAGQSAMNLLKFILIACVAWSAVHDRIWQIVGAQGLGFMQIFALGGSVIYAIAMRIGLALLTLAVVDYAWQRYRIEQDLKMSKQEVKEEMRSMDGDPKIKQRRRQIAMQIARAKLKKVVPTADVIITNPTEFAVALKYEGDSMHAPRVIAKGQGHLAARIRQLAIEAGVPILERKPLARALYKLVPVGHEIPEQFYAAVAEILAYVYELSGRKAVAT